MVEDDDCKDTKKQNRLNEMLILFCLCPEPGMIYDVLSSHSEQGSGSILDLSLPAPIFQ
jgi:hypothetical protein